MAEDASLVDTIVGQVKSQGLFDQFRRECLADVDTKPAFQNLRQLVETTVSKFLSKQDDWTPELNKNHLRDKLRRHITQMNFLDAGVERIVEQVVSPKISTVFRPKIEEMVYDHLGIERPRKEEELEPPGISQLSLENPPPPPPPPPPEDVTECEVSSMSVEETDLLLLPTDLEAVSPDSSKSGSNPDLVKLEPEQSSVDREEVVEEEVVKMEEDLDEESPPFEPLEAVPSNEDFAIKTESQESTISGLTSQDSVESDPGRVAMKETPPVKEEVEESSTGVLKEDSQLSQVSSDTQNSSKFPDAAAATNEEPLKMDISEEAQMPSQFPEQEPGDDNSKKKEVLTNFSDLQKEAITFEQAKREEKSPSGEAVEEGSSSDGKVETISQTSLENPNEEEEKGEKKDSPIPEPPVEPQQMVDNVCPSGEVNKILVKTSVAEDTEESLLDSGDSMDLKIVESDSQGSVSNSNHSADTKDSTTTTTTKKEGEVKSSSSSHRSRSHHHHSHGHHRSSSSSTSQHRSSSSNHKSSSRDKDRHRSRDHHKSSSDRSKSSRKDSSSSRRRDEKDKDKEKEKEKDKNKEKKNGSSCRESRGERRSTDRDSNDGTNSGSQPKSVPNGGEKTSGGSLTTTTTTGDNQKTSPTSSPSTGGQTNSAKSPSGELTDRVQQPIVVDQLLEGQELKLQMRVPTPTSPEKQVLKKPKIAANMKEAMKLMKVRKMMDLQKAKEEERAVVEANKSYGQPDSDDGEESLHYFPEENSKFQESKSEKWWKQIKAKPKEEDLELVKKVKEFVGEISKATTMKRPATNDSKDRDSKRPKTETKKTKPLNGLTSTATTTEQLDVDVDDYHEAEIDLDDLSQPLLTENNNVQKENKNYGMVFNKLVNGDAELELNSVPEMTSSPERIRVPKAPVTQTQRYTSEDLYKPRPVIGRSRRSRNFGDTAEGSR